MNDAIGALLRETREATGLTLEDVERATRIRVKYLAVIEAGEFEAIPSRVQTRGFLRIYSEYLGLNAEEVLAQFDPPAARRRPLPGGWIGAVSRPRPAAARAPAPPVGQPASPARASPPASPSRAPRVLVRRAARLLSADILVGGVVILALVGFFLWGSSRLASVLFSATPRATPLELGRPSDTPTPALTLVSATSVTPAAATPAPPAQALTEVAITLNFEQTAWVSVTVDGVEAFRGLIAPGNTQEYVGQDSIEVLTGNGAGVRVIYGGRDEGVLGAFGEVVMRIYTLTGALTPTASQTPAVTDTPTPRPVTDTPTRVPSRTARPTATPRFTPAGPATASRTPTLAPTATLRPSETVPPSPTQRP